MSCKELTPESIVQGSLSLLGRPAKLMNRMGDLYDMMGISLERFRNKLHIHDGDFILKMRRVTLPSQQLELSIDIPDWGRPVSCDLDPDSVPADVLLPSRDVALIALRDADLFRRNQDYGYISDPMTIGTVAFASAVSWFRSDSKIKFFFEFGGARPYRDVTYRFFYQPGGISQVLEGQSVEWLNEFIGLLQLDCALLFLPHADLDDKTYNRLETRFEKAVMQRESVLDLWLQQDHTEQSGFVGGWNRTLIGGNRRLR